MHALDTHASINIDICSKTPIMAGSKKYHPDKTEGARLTKQLRREMNDLSDDKMDELFRSGMAVIYGKGKTPVRPRH
jgi:hypothetical protein